jgi:hypothetical protein
MAHRLFVTRDRNQKDVSARCRIGFPWHNHDLPLWSVVLPAEYSSQQLHCARPIGEMIKCMPERAIR